MYNQSLKCLAHNQDAIGINKNAELTKQLQCIQCLQEQNKIIPIEEAQKKKNQIIDSLTNNQQQKIDTLNQVNQLIVELRNELQSRLNKLLEIIQQQITEINNQITHYTNYYGKMNFIEERDVEQEIHNQNILSYNIMGILQKQISYLRVENKIQKISDKVEEIKKQQVTNFLNTQENKMNYSLLDSYQEVKQCNAIAIKDDLSIILASSGNNINIFQFEGQNNLKLIQTLKGHRGTVNCLQLMKTQKQFLSGSADWKINVWNQNDDGSWQKIKQLEEHQGEIQCIAINCSDSLFVSAGIDFKLNFWNYNYDWQLIQSNQYTNYIQSLCFDSQGNQLFCSGFNNSIFIFRKVNQQWQVVQTFEQRTGPGFCLIDDVTFTFQSIFSYNLDVYIFDKNEKKFNKISQCEVEKNTEHESYFERKFISFNQILFVKNDNKIIFYRRNRNQTFTLEGSIKLKGEIYGTVSEKSQYIITWDKEQKLIQVWKLNFLPKI